MGRKLGDEHKYHLVNWKHICDSIRYGGLGIRNVVGFNKALLGKWLWRYAMEREALWLKVIDAKYGSMWGVGAQKCLEDRMGSAYGSQSVLVGIVFPASSRTQ
jgi:hypothetical protein